ncbi:MAG TPA: glycosyltransferase family 2 protein, partial [Agriterribacter sp.]|nr:glycosyltransferase family 2 protein [Agriterribacter sp.]
MEELPLVSIITIVYNGEKFIEKCIQSVLDQSYPNIEYIVIDGGSSDHTVDIIERYTASIKHWISEKDKGISDAFNKGLKRATGEIVGMINADDWYEPNTVEKIVQEIDDFDIVYGDLRLWKNDA